MLQSQILCCMPTTYSPACVMTKYCSSCLQTTSTGQCDSVKTSFILKHWCLLMLRSQMVLNKMNTHRIPKRWTKSLETEHHRSNLKKEEWRCKFGWTVLEEEKGTVICCVCRDASTKNKCNSPSRNKFAAGCVSGLPSGKYKELGMLETHLLSDCK